MVAAPPESPAPEAALLSSLRLLAEHLGADRADPFDDRRLRLALGRYVRAAVAAGRTLDDVTQTVSALVQSLANAQSWAAEDATTTGARLAGLVIPMYAVETLAIGR